MKSRVIGVILALSAFAVAAKAQGVESPPVTSFKPDTTMPSVNVPEFVITGRAQIELPRADKPTVEIDSSYFQGKELPGVEVGVPLYRSLGDQYNAEGKPPSSLFVRASIGHYSSARYLASGIASVGGFNFSGSLSGDYTSGFISNTMRRDFSIQGGISKDLNVDGGVKSSNSMNLGYSRSSYSLYGESPRFLQRSTDEVRFGINSDMYLDELPLAFALNFNRFSLADDWDNTQSSLKLKASTQVQLSSGWLGFSGAVLLGDHTLSASSTNPVLALPLPVAVRSINRSLYDLVFGASYGSTLFLGKFSYSLGLTYFQYRDDSLNTVAKLYPDARLNYRFNETVSLFVGFSATVREANLSEFLTTDPYADGVLTLVNTQDYADFTLGSTVALNHGITLAPQIDYRNSKYFPVFVSNSVNRTSLLYSGKCSILSFSLKVGYREGSVSSDLTLRYQSGKVDSLSSIPNLSPFNADLALAYKITPQFTASASVLFLSSRYADLGLSEKLNPVGLLDFRLAYDFEVSRLPVQVFAGGDNVLNERYFIWQGYQEFPMTLYLGISSTIL